LVIVDTPPVMAVSDAAVLAKIVDATVFVVRWAETPRETVKTALHQLGNMDVKVTGLVMSQVDLKRQAAYGYGDYGYYYGRYKEYYAE
ncbi:MAG TPA: protein tyrosine kinase, partial [Kiloniellales bacterium]|nr:protein tyrosine kinase [Kiloniellales bacterium]